jgi:hypothetical protein
MSIQQIKSVVVTRLIHQNPKLPNLITSTTLKLASNNIPMYVWSINSQLSLQINSQKWRHLSIIMSYGMSNRMIQWISYQRTIVSVVGKHPMMTVLSMLNSSNNSLGNLKVMIKLRRRIVIITQRRINRWF